jgi:sugar-specific transcriptional regulator TrmB
MDEILKKIINIGLTKNEAKIFYHLLKNGGQTASELSKIIGINRSNIYSILSNLISKGLCKEVAGKVARFYAISPNESFDLIKQDLDKKINDIEQLSKLLLPLYNNSSTNQKLIDFIEILHTKASITQKITEIEKNTEYSIKIFGKFPYIHEPPKENDKPCFKNKSVKYQYLYEIDKEGRYKMLGKFYKKHFGDVKVIDYLPIKMMISDEKFIIFSVINECTNQLTTIFINNTQLGKLMSEIFDIYWERANEF